MGLNRRPKTGRKFDGSKLVVDNNAIKTVQFEAQRLPEFIIEDPGPALSQRPTPTVTPTVSSTPVSPTPTKTPTITPTVTKTEKPTPTPSKTVRATPSVTKSPKATPSTTRTPGASPTPTKSTQATPTITPTNTKTPTYTPTKTITPSNTSTPDKTPTPTKTKTPTNSLSATQTLSNFATPSVTRTSTITPTITKTNTRTPTVTATSSLTPTNEPTQSETPTLTPTLTPTISPTRTEGSTPTVTRTETVTPTVSKTPRQTSSPTKTPVASKTPKGSPSNTPTNTQTPTYTPTNTASPTLTPTVTRTSNSCQCFRINNTSTEQSVIYFYVDCRGVNSNGFIPPISDTNLGVEHVCGSEVVVDSIATVVLEGPCGPGNSCPSQPIGSRTPTPTKTITSTPTKTPPITQSPTLSPTVTNSLSASPPCVRPAGLEGNTGYIIAGWFAGANYTGTFTPVQNLSLAAACGQWTNYSTDIDSSAQAIVIIYSVWDVDGIIYPPYSQTSNTCDCGLADGNYWVGDVNPIIAPSKNEPIGIVTIINCRITSIESCNNLPVESPTSTPTQTLTPTVTTTVTTTPGFSPTPSPTLTQTVTMTMTKTPDCLPPGGLKTYTWVYSWSSSASGVNNFQNTSVDNACTQFFNYLSDTSPSNVSTVSFNASVIEVGTQIYVSQVSCDCPTSINGYFWVDMNQQDIPANKASTVVSIIYIENCVVQSINQCYPSFSPTPTPTQTLTPTVTQTVTASPIIPPCFGYLYNFMSLTGTGLNSITSSDEWIIPSQSDTTILINFVGADMKSVRLDDVVTYWFPNTEVPTNIYKFNAIGNGGRNASGTFDNAFRVTNYYWTTTTSFAGASRLCMMVSNVAFPMANNYAFAIKSGNPTRLLKTSTILTNGQSGTYIGNDGRVYETICIGTQEWLAEDLKETKYRNLTTIPNVTDNTEWASLTTGAYSIYNNDNYLVSGCDPVGPQPSPTPTPSTTTPCVKDGFTTTILYADRLFTNPNNLGSAFNFAGLSLQGACNYYQGGSIQWIDNPSYFAGTTQNNGLPREVFVSGYTGGGGIALQGLIISSSQIECGCSFINNGTFWVNRIDPTLPPTLESGVVSVQYDLNTCVMTVLDCGAPPPPAPDPSPSPTVTPTVQVTPTPTVTPTTAIILQTCDILTVFNRTVYKYSLSSNSSIVLPGIQPNSSSTDIAHTQTKIWITREGFTTIQQWDLTLSPYGVTTPLNLTSPDALGKGLFAIDNSNLISTRTVGGVQEFININVSNTSNVVNTALFTSGMLVVDDIVVTQDGYLLAVGKLNNFTDYRLRQWQYPSGNLVIDSALNPGFNPSGIFVSSNLVYVTGVNGEIYKINENSPWGGVLVNNAPEGYEGVSQVASCITNGLTPQGLPQVLRVGSIPGQTMSFYMDTNNALIGSIVYTSMNLSVDWGDGSNNTYSVVYDASFGTSAGQVGNYTPVNHTYAAGNSVTATLTFTVLQPNQYQPPPLPVRVMYIRRASSISAPQQPFSTMFGDSIKKGLTGLAFQSCQISDLSTISLPVTLTSILLEANTSNNINFNVNGGYPNSLEIFTVLSCTLTTLNVDLSNTKLSTTSYNSNVRTLDLNANTSLTSATIILPNTTTGFMYIRFLALNNMTTLTLSSPTQTGNNALIDVTSLYNLTVQQCLKITTWNYLLPTGVRIFSVNGNRTTTTTGGISSFTLNLSNNNNNIDLQTFYWFSNRTSTFNPTNLSGCLGINVMRLYDNLLTTLPTLPANVTELILSNNKFTSRPTLPSNLQILVFGGTVDSTVFTNLNQTDSNCNDFSNLFNNASDTYLTNLSSLRNFKIRNCKLTAWNCPFPDSIELIDFGSGGTPATHKNILTTLDFDRFKNVIKINAFDTTLNTINNIHLTTRLSEIYFEQNNINNQNNFFQPNPSTIFFPNTLTRISIYNNPLTASGPWNRNLFGPTGTLSITNIDMRSCDLTGSSVNYILNYFAGLKTAGRIPSLANLNLGNVNVNTRVNSAPDTTTGGINGCSALSILRNATSPTVNVTVVTGGPCP